MCSWKCATVISRVTVISWVAVAPIGMLAVAFIRHLDLVFETKERHSSPIEFKRPRACEPHCCRLCATPNRLKNPCVKRFRRKFPVFRKLRLLARLLPSFCLNYSQRRITIESTDDAEPGSIDERPRTSHWRAFTHHTKSCTRLHRVRVSTHRSERI